MKKPLYALAALLIFQSLFGQDPDSRIDGVWQGALLFGQGKIRVLIYLSPSKDDAYHGAMVNLDSGTALNIDLITYANGKLALELKSTGFKFEGTLSPSGREI
ncbi:MAG: hypothetical protein ABSH31_16280, partial [Bryobacteraceae bacterium]